MKNPKKNEWLHQYNEFISYEETQIPMKLSKQVFSKMDILLNPKALTIFFKVLGIHLAVGFLSLSICHQFGMNPFNTSQSLADLFMRWAGHGVCMVFCGFLFMGLSFSAAGFIFSVEEVLTLKKTGFQQTLGLSVVSLGVFFMAGADLALTFAGLWLLGAFIGSFFVTQATLYFRKLT